MSSGDSDEGLEQIGRSLLGGSFRACDVLRVWIPKASGSRRGLGIPNVVDRIVQQAVHQVLSPHYEKTFHEWSLSITQEWTVPCLRGDARMPHLMRRHNAGRSFRVGVKRGQVQQLLAFQRVARGLRVPAAMPKRRSILAMLLALVAACIAACGTDDRHGGPGGGIGPAGATVGGPCVDDADCSQRCVRDDHYPGGMCTVWCQSDHDCPAGTACIDDEGGMCAVPCGSAGSCSDFRPGWSCDERERRGHDGDVGVCRKE